MSKQHQLMVLDQVDALANVHKGLLDLDASLGKEEASEKILPILDLINVAKDQLIDYGYYIGNL